MDKRYIGHAEQARMIRAQLKRHFPGVTFSVRSRSYAGGASIDIKWIDGPLYSAVNAITSPFAGGGFDGMIDMAYNVDSWLCPDGSVSYGQSVGTQGSLGSDPAYSHPAPCEGAELVSFAANHVFCSRRIGPDVANAAIAQLVAYWGGITEKPVAVAGGYAGEFKLEPESMGRKPIREDLSHMQDWYSMIRQAAEDPKRFEREELPRVEVSQEIADAFGMVGLPNLSIVE